MRFCFILEKKYVDKPMPMVVADQLKQWGHQIDVIQPYSAITSLTELALVDYDAYVLKTVSAGPGLPILPKPKGSPCRRRTLWDILEP
jgi:ribosomal protein S6--L-glutamate ligase